jgi:nucleoside-diphosphate-sugar epimerase
MTGGYGCIGSWVALRAIERGLPVAIFDLREDRHRVELLLDPVALEQVNYIPGDVSDSSAVLRAVDEAGATHVLHLAGLQVPTCRADPMLGARVNVLGTLAVFEAARQRRDQVARVVYASSAAVHAPPSATSAGPLGDDVRLAPTTHYGAFKVCNEHCARVYWLDHGIRSIGLRPWTVYGVGRDFGVTSEPTKAIKAVAAGRRYHISYGGRQDLQYAGDVASAFLLALEAPFEGGEAFNIRGDVVTIETFVATLREIAPEAAALVTHGDRQLPIEPDLDDSRLQAAIGPLPRTPLHDGIADTHGRFASLRSQNRLDLSDLS